METRFLFSLFALAAATVTFGSHPALAFSTDRDRSEMTGLRTQAMGAILEQQETGNLPFQVPMVVDPTQGAMPQAVGFYSKGSLEHPNELPIDGRGFMKIALRKNRGFATFDLIRIIETVALAIHRAFPDGERLQIADIAAMNGGSIGHKSHQNGLDADVAYLRVNHMEQDPGLTRPGSGLVESFIDKYGVSSNFDLQRNWELIKALVRTGRVNRIFVHPLIKEQLCAFASSQGELSSHTETLRRLRPDDDHYDHMHVRITCPVRSPRCVMQEDPPTGSGCDQIYVDNEKPDAPTD